MRKIPLTIVTISVLFCIAAASPAVRASSDKASEPIIPITPPAPKFSVSERHEELAARRNRVADAMDDNSMLIMFSADSKIYTNDVDYHYRQENNLYYLTALKQNGITLVIAKDGGVVKEILFLPKRNPQFETWNGRMYSNADATRLSGIENIVDARQQKAFLASLGERKPFTSTDGKFTNSFVPENIYLLKGNRREFGKEQEFGNELAEKLKGSPEAFTIKNALPIFARLRLVKSPYELKILQHAIDITAEGLGRSMGMVHRANWEYEVHAEMEYTFRRRNADFWGFPSIVGCGPNATTLHYVESQGKVTNGALMLMDVGAEYDHYTADITRTFPVNGKFSKAQAEIYQIVYDAQEAAARQLRPGSTIGAASRAARAEIEKGLAKLGLIDSPGATIEMSFRGRKIQQPQSRLWFMHGWGHWLGMNVHDVGNYSVELKPGMVTTNEPGIYIREDALDYLPDTPKNKQFLQRVRPVFEKYKSIGVRIEDDMLITSDGVKWMTKDLPRTIEGVEAFIKAARKKMKNYAINSEIRKSVVGPDALADLGYRGFDLLNAGRLPQGSTFRRGWIAPKPNSIDHAH